MKINKGITIISLIITIIVLLTLAAISISFLSGDNGILSKAIRAKEEQAKSEAEEQLKLKLSEILVEHSSEVSLNYLDGMIIDQYNVTVSDIGKIIVLNKDNQSYSFFVTEYNGSFSVQELGNLTISGQSLNESNLSQEKIPVELLCIGKTSTSISLKVNILDTSKIRKVYIYNGNELIYSGIDITYTIQNVQQNVQYNLSAYVEYNYDLKLSEKAVTIYDGVIDYWTFTSGYENAILGRTSFVKSYGIPEVVFSAEGADLRSNAIKTNGNYMLPTNFTMAFEYKPTAINAWGIVIGKITDYPSYSTYNGFFVHSSNSIGKLTNGYEVGSFNPLSYLTVNERAKIAITFDGTNVKLYINGQLVETEVGYRDLSAPLYLAGNQYNGTTSGGVPWQLEPGYYRNLMIYNRALSSEEISGLFN